MSLSRDFTATAERQALVTVHGIDRLWHTMTGGDVTVEYATEDYAGTVCFIPGKRRAAPIVLTTTLSVHKDLTWVRKIKALVGVESFTITRQWIDPNGTTVGEPETYPECLLIGYGNPVSSPATDDVEFTLTFATTGEAL